MRLSTVWAAPASILLIAGAASADPVTITRVGSNANGQAAEARFVLNDFTNTVTIRITNTSAGSVGTRDISALFWSFSNAQTLTATFTGTPGSGTWDANNVTSSNGGVGNFNHTYNAEQMWGFRNNFGGGPPLNAQYGLGSAGLSSPYNFPQNSILQSGGPHPQPDGPDGTIIPAAGSDPFATRPLFRGYVEFVFAVPNSFFGGDARNIGVSNTTIQFGTSSDDNNQVTLVPLPPAAWAGLASLAGIGGFGYIRRRSFRA